MLSDRIALMSRDPGRIKEVINVELHPAHAPRT